MSPEKKIPSGFFSTNNGRTDHERNCLQKEKVKTVEFWSKNQIFGVRIQDLRRFWEFYFLVHDPKTQNFHAPAARIYSYEYFSETAKFSRTAAKLILISVSQILGPRGRRNFFLILSSVLHTLKKTYTKPKEISFFNTIFFRLRQAIMKKKSVKVGKNCALRARKKRERNYVKFNTIKKHWLNQLVLHNNLAPVTLATASKQCFLYVK